VHRPAQRLLIETRSCKLFVLASLELWSSQSLPLE
jgi:hypothetical protein